uniref:Uncharacterized protein n=1 Tax=Lepeophtheirus salmonis TaxID=72036 RepID=A0A0K2UNK3_LEPSM
MILFVFDTLKHKDQHIFLLQWPSLGDISMESRIKRLFSEYSSNYYVLQIEKQRFLNKDEDFYNL